MAHSRYAKRALELQDVIDPILDNENGVTAAMFLMAALGARLMGMPEKVRTPELNQLIELLPKIIAGIEWASIQHQAGEN